MFGIPRRYAHFVFGIIQSGLTSAIAAAIGTIGVAVSSASRMKPSPKRWSW